MHSAVLLPLVLLPFSLALQQNVTVGKGGGLIFNPTNVTAGKGDTIQFTFYPQNHSIAQSTFDHPCEPLKDGIFSGFFPVKDGTAKQVFTVTLNDTDPKWIYCSQGKHCQNGMAMVINPPDEKTSNGKTLANYKQSAQKVAESGSQTEIKGGVIADASSSGNSSASGSSTTATAATTAATSGSATISTTNPSASGNATSAGGKVSAQAGLGALGLLGFLVSGMV